MKCLLIINPKAGLERTQHNLNKLVGQLILEEIVDHVDVFYTKKKDDAYQRALSSHNNYDFILSYGGDGTVNEVISGIIESESDIPLIIYPGGTVNDFATHLNMPKNQMEFLKVIKKKNIKNVDVGKINDHYFANVISCGMFSDISFQVSAEDKAKFGPLAYYLTGIRQFPKQISTNMHLHITTKEEVFDEDASLFMITNTSQVGGIKNITPEANIQDGLLDLLIIRKCQAYELIQIIRDYALDNLVENPYIHYVQSSYIKIESDSELIYDVDGEIGTGFPMEISLSHNKLKVYMP